MRYFEVVDSRRRSRQKRCGLLCWDEATRQFTIEIEPDATIRDVPMLFMPFIEKGERHIPPEWAIEWVRERIAPPNRQNIGEILEAHDLEEYDELTLLLSGDGRCSQDEFMIREVERKKIAASGSKSRMEYAYVALEPAASVQLKSEFGRAVRDMRKHRHMGQEELSVRSGVPRAMISRIERGFANPTLETVAALAKGLACEASVLLAPQI